MYIHQEYPQSKGEEHSQKEERYIRKEYSPGRERDIRIRMKGIFARNIHQAERNIRIRKKGIFARNIRKVRGNIRNRKEGIFARNIRQREEEHS